jgi:PAS domain S-box-containing protein
MYKLFFDSNPVGSFIVEEDGKIKAFNKVFLENIGFDKDYDLMSDHTFNIKNVMGEFNHLSNILSEKGSVVAFDTYVKTSNYDFKPYKVNCSHFCDDNNQRLIVGSLTPISELKPGDLGIADERKKYEDIMNNSVQLIQSFDKNGKILFVNKAWQKTFGYENEEIHAINLFDIIADEDKAHCAEIFQNIIKGIPAFDIRASFVSKSGKKILLKGNVLPMLSNGELIATHAFFNDTSELNVVKQELASKEIILETIFKSIPVCLYLKDYEGKYIYANDIMKQTMGCDVTGKTDAEIFDAANAQIMKQTDLEAMEAVNQNITFTFTLENGDLKKYFYCGKKTINADDQAKLLFGYTLDITELKNKTAKIEENERILNQIVSNTNTGIMLLRLNKNKNNYELDFINDTCKKIVRFTDDKSHVSELIPELLPEIEKLINNPEHLSGIYEFAVSDSDRKSYYDVYISHINLPDNDHKLLVFFNNVSEKREMIDHLELKLKENDLLLAEVHHRVKNNLANIYGIIELNKYKFHQTDYEQYLIEIQLKIKSIALVHELLYKSRSLTKISLGQYFTELCHEYKKIYKSAYQMNANFDLALDNLITIDLGRAINLGLMLGELLSNSFKHASVSNQVTITISLQSINGRYSIDYTDSGSGFTGSQSNPNPSGFGLKLVNNVLKQIKSNHTFNTANKFHLHFDFEQL